MGFFVRSSGGIIMGLLLAACDTGLAGSSYDLEAPPLPAAWLEILGPPHWRLEWVSSGGGREVSDTGPEDFPEISLLTGWTVPVLASPYWPERGISPGIMRPAGALFPYDAQKHRLSLSWRGGLEAWIYFEMAAGNTGEGDPDLKTPRQHHYFNWPRFREFLEGPEIAEELRQDPWLADWEAIVARILQSGFDKRRILPRSSEVLRIPLPAGDAADTPWIGASPFAGPLLPEPGGELRLPVSEAVDTYFSTAGFLRCTRGVWARIPWVQ
ncbi:MAG: hypothetical protein LBP43_03255 [Treponema sp.]|jgi:hypothetical protein|nr:hypothetical protein [Treponema sp.]